MTEEEVIAAAPHSVGEIVSTYRDVRLPKTCPEAPSTVFEPGTLWKIVRVFVVEVSGQYRRRLASHGVSVVTYESNIRSLKPEESHT